MALSVSTPEHLHKIGLLNEIVNDTGKGQSLTVSKNKVQLDPLKSNFKWIWKVHLLQQSL